MTEKVAAVENYSEQVAVGDLCEYGCEAKITPEPQRESSVIVVLAPRKRIISARRNPSVKGTHVLACSKGGTARILTDFRPERNCIVGDEGPFLLH